MSWKPEVVADSTGKWIGNALRFATEEEALANVRDLAARWTSVRETRVVECGDPVNYTFVNGKLAKYVEQPSAFAGQGATGFVGGYSRD